MKPYVESGRYAQELLEQQNSTYGPNEQRLRSNLRGFKQVINLLGVTGIVLIPLIGVMTRSSFIAAVVALNFLGIIVLLEMMERRVKTALTALRDKRLGIER